MSAIKVRNYNRDDALIWELEGNQFEFTPDEYQELLTGIKTEGLFNFLKSQRRSLLAQIEEVYLLHLKDEDEKQVLEARLEQSLLSR